MNIDNVVYVGFTLTVLAMGLFAAMLFQFVILFIANSSLNSDKTYAEKDKQILCIKQFIYFFLTASSGFMLFISFSNFTIDYEALNIFIIGTSASSYIVSILHLTEGLRLRRSFKQHAIARINCKDDQILHQSAYVPISRTKRYYFHVLFVSTVYVSLYRVADGQVSFYMISFVCLYIACLLFDAIQYVRDNYLTEKIIFYVIILNFLYIFFIIVATFLMGAEKASLFVIGVQAISYILWSGALMVLLTSDNTHIHYQNSIKDLSTGLYNRRYFSTSLDEICDKSSTRQSSVALIVCDIDNFKNINDQYGHDIGDVVIQNFSKRLQAQIRDTDILSRIGGEEFAIILPKTDLETARNIAESMCTNTEKSAITINVAQHNKNSRLKANIDKNIASVEILITGSFGVSVSSMANNYNPTMLYKNADEAMYKSKETGKNKVTIVDYH